MIFAEPHAPGEDVKPIFGLGDDIVDFEILANRPDCLSVWGLARESASVLGERFNPVSYTHLDAPCFAPQFSILLMNLINHKSMPPFVVHFSLVDSFVNRADQRLSLIHI